MQKIWSDSGYVGKINDKNFFQCLALPKDRQSFCEVQKKCHQIFSKKINVALRLFFPRVYDYFGLVYNNDM